ncbi:MAG TPA: polysaccharide deacetylase family protein [Polyangia bacterium]|nr:polysaccharide deacetylase family protein [Polyangia bacterium]
MPRLACINIDLDGLLHYAAIHGLAADALPAGAADAVDRLAIDRFVALCDGAGVKGTLFAIGSDLRAHGQGSLRAAARGGHEVGNHTRAHDYALSRRTNEEIAADIAGGAADIEAVCGVRPRGFRAPGYTFTAAMYAALVGQNYAYGSSVFPAAPYYLAKAAVMGALAIKGTPSRSVLDRPRVLTAPVLPYRPDPAEPYRRGDGAVPELPITVAPFTRFPFIGTFVTTLPAAMVFALYRSVARRPFLNLELHGIDLLDESDGSGPALAAAQRDLRVPAAAKLARLTDLFQRIKQDYDVVTLLDAAAAF